MPPPSQEDGPKKARNSAAADFDQTFNRIALALAQKQQAIAKKFPFMNELSSSSNSSSAAAPSTRQQSQTQPTTTTITQRSLLDDDDFRPAPLNAGIGYAATPSSSSSTSPSPFPSRSHSPASSTTTPGGTANGTDPATSLLRRKVLGRNAARQLELAQRERERGQRGTKRGAAAAAGGESDDDEDEGKGALVRAKRARAGLGVDDVAQLAGRRRKKVRVADGRGEGGELLSGQKSGDGNGANGEEGAGTSVEQDVVMGEGEGGAEVETIEEKADGVGGPGGTGDVQTGGDKKRKKKNKKKKKKNVVSGKSEVDAETED